MIPQALTVHIDPSIPLGARFWMPGEDDMSEEGIGFFRDTWLIAGTSLRDSSSVSDAEWQIVEIIDALSPDVETFEHLAEAVESNDPESWPRYVVETPAGGDLRASLGVEPRNEGLDLGVAGLVYALAAVGCVPAASCRGNHGDHSWSPHPIVLFAADRGRVRWLEPLVRESSCGFLIDDLRPDLLAIVGRSIGDMMLLGRRMIEHARRSGLADHPDAGRGSRDRAGDEPTLF